MSDLGELLVYADIAVVAIGVGLWVMIFRHIKYLHTIYGGKYILMLLAAAVIFASISSNSFLADLETYFILSFGGWIVLLFFKGLIGLWNNPHFQQGMKNYNNLGALNEDWAPREKSRMIGGAPEPQRKTKKTAKNSSAKSNKPKAGSGGEITRRQEPERTRTGKKAPTPFSSKHKVCATCAMWGGNREVQPSRVVVHTESSNDRGQCIGGGHNRAQVPAAGHCSEYSKWEVLK